MSAAGTDCLTVPVGNHAWASAPDGPLIVDKLAKLPIFLNLEGKRAVVVGSGNGAVWKARLLAAAGAEVAIFATSPSDGMEAMVDLPGSGITLHRRAWCATDFVNVSIALLEPSGEPTEIGKFCIKARSVGALVNVIDTPEACDFQFGTIVNRSPVIIGISTDGASPILGQALRRRIEAILPREIGSWARAALRFRARLAQRLPGRIERRAFWERFVDLVFADAGKAGSLSQLERIANEVHAESQSKQRDPASSVCVLSVDPDDQGELTLSAVRIMQAADVIVHDRSIAASVLELGRREAQRIAVHDEAEADRLLRQLASGAPLRIVRMRSTKSSSSTPQPGTGDRQPTFSLS